MDFEYDEQQAAIRDLAAKILSEQVTETSLRALDEKCSFHHSRAWHELSKAGLLGVAIPTEHGGMGGGLLELVALLEQIGRHVAPVPAVASLVLGALPVARHGSGDQRARWLPRVAQGEIVLSGALEEQGSADVLETRTQALARGDGFSVHGTKLCVPLLDQVTRVVVPVRAADDTLGLMLVDPNAPGVSRVAGVATHGEPVFTLVLDDVYVPAEDVLTAPSRDVRALRGWQDAATVALCAVQMGVAARALEMTAAYTSQRIQFGVPIGSFQAVHQRAADAYIDAECIRLATLQAAFLWDDARDASLAAASAKFHAAEAGYRVTFAAQHLHGGIGYDVDYPLHRYYRWSKAMELSLGAAPQQLERLGEQLAAAPVRIAQ